MLKTINEKLAFKVNINCKVENFSMKTAQTAKRSLLNKNNI
jgi:hypothetical protein